MMQDLDRPDPFEPSVNDELTYRMACDLIDKASPDQLRTIAKDFARQALCTQRGAMRWMARKAAAGEVIRYQLGEG